MKSLLLPFLLLVSSTGFSQSLEDLDEKNGFRKLHFGDALAKLPEAKWVEGESNTKYYVLPVENLRIGGAKLKSIYYGFYKGKFCSVIIRTSNLVDSKALKLALEETYGPGYQSNKHIEHYYWLGKVVGMSYYAYSINGTAKVFLQSEEIKQQKEENENAAGKAKSDQ